LLAAVLFFGIFVVFITLIFFYEYFTSLNVRVIAWQNGIRFLLENWEYIFTGVPIDVPVHYKGRGFSDNYFIYIVIRAGILPALIFIALYLSILKRAIDKIVTREKNEVILISAFFVAISIFPLFLSNYIMFYPIPILLGISAGHILGRADTENVGFKTA
jgi:hypothetical protein